MELFKRENYLKKVRGFYNDSGIIKVFTGIRRCGKSCLMQTIVQELKDKNISEEQIIYIDLDRRGFKNIKSQNALENKIDELTKTKKLKYLFIDEIQNVKNFEEVLNAFRMEGDYSIFITGSNSYLLSGELISKLTGRYIEIEVFTLSFSEYLSMKKMYKKSIDSNLQEEFTNYIIEGGFPKTVQYDSLDDKRTYVQSVVNEIFEKDIKKQNKIRHVSVFNRVRDYIINNFGATTSIKNILDYFYNQEKINIKRETLNRYIQILVDSKIIYPCSRFDLKSRKSLASEQKYYLSDLSFYYALNTDNRINYGPELENIIYFYSKSKNYSVSVGRIGKLECDFILRNAEQNYFYIQVALTIADKKTEDREYAPLESIKDNYPKYVMTTDLLLQKRNGIHHVNLIDFISHENNF